MKQAFILLSIALIFASCGNYPQDQQTKDLIQYNKTHTAYPDSEALKYAIEHQITPDSAMVLRAKGIR